MMFQHWCTECTGAHQSTLHPRRTPEQAGECKVCLFRCKKTLLVARAPKEESCLCLMGFWSMNQASYLVQYSILDAFIENNWPLCADERQRLNSDALRWRSKDVVVFQEIPSHLIQYPRSRVSSLPRVLISCSWGTVIGILCQWAISRGLSSQGQQPASSASWPGPSFLGLWFCLFVCLFYICVHLYSGAGQGSQNPSFLPYSLQNTWLPTSPSNSTMARSNPGPR